MSNAHLLIHLPTELLLQVFSDVAWTEWDDWLHSDLDESFTASDMQALRLTCKAFNDITSPMLVQFYDTSYGTSSLVKLTKFMLKHPNTDSRLLQLNHDCGNSSYEDLKLNQLSPKSSLLSIANFLSTLPQEMMSLATDVFSSLLLGEDDAWMTLIILLSPRLKRLAVRTRQKTPLTLSLFEAVANVQHQCRIPGSRDMPLQVYDRFAFWALRVLYVSDWQESSLKQNDTWASWINVAFSLPSLLELHIIRENPCNVMLGHMATKVSNIHRLAVHTTCFTTKTLAYMINACRALKGLSLLLPNQDSAPSELSFFESALSTHLKTLAELEVFSESRLYQHDELRVVARILKQSRTIHRFSYSDGIYNGFYAMGIAIHEDLPPTINCLEDACLAIEGKEHVYSDQHFEALLKFLSNCGTKYPSMSCLRLELWKDFKRQIPRATMPVELVTQLLRIQRAATENRVLLVHET